MGAAKGNKLYDSLLSLNENQVNSLITKDFKSEKDLCDYIERNIQLFCIDVLNDLYISHKKEFTINGYNQSKNSKRIDFFIECEKYKYIIELKNPFYKSELSYGIGQLLTYSILIDKADKNFKFILITTKYDDLSARIINEYKLPIDIIIFSKAKYLKYLSNV
jgi:hypothetical protein